MVSKHVLLSVQRPDYDSEPDRQSKTEELTGSDRFGDVQMVLSPPKSPDIHEDEVKINEKREADGNYVCI